MNPVTEVIILAAGQGTRMRSALPKVLHCIGGQPMLRRVFQTAQRLAPKAIHIVHGHGGETVRERLADLPARWVLQAERLGTGHAVQQAMPDVADDGRVLILYGDVPLIEADTLERLLEASAGGLAVLTAELADASGYGRIVRDRHGRVRRIVEQKDASAQEQTICEINSGLLAADARRLRGWLARLGNDNAQGEYYLTDVVALAVADGVEVNTVAAPNGDQIAGVNDPQQLAALERVLQKREAQRLMRAGLRLADPARFDLRGELLIGRDVFIDVNVIIEGRVRLGDNVRVGAHCILKNVEVAADAQIHPMSLIEDAQIGSGAQIGPFARIRPATQIEDGARVGNFVEIKKSRIGKGSKVNHLSYIGDTQMGAEVNVGAGVITCNYDGANKHPTTIGDGAFIGSDTQLVAPVTVQPGATLGAGSTITKDAPADRLTLSRSKQITLDGWKRPPKTP